MNNKGFTLIEVLVTLVVISTVLIIVTKYIGNTLSITKNESYKLMKHSITTAAKDYINECNSNIINCNLKWENNVVIFKASVLKKTGYFKNLNSPIDNKNLEDCIEIIATKKNGIITTKINDNCY